MKSEELRVSGKRIQSLRKSSYLTQEKLAELMNVSVQMVSNLERGNKAIKIDNLINLSRIFNVSTDFILKGVNGNVDYDTVLGRFNNLNEKDRGLVETVISYLSQE